MEDSPYHFRGRPLNDVPQGKTSKRLSNERKKMKIILDSMTLFNYQTYNFLSEKAKEKQKPTKGRNDP